MALSNIVVPTPYISKTLWGDPITARVNLLSKPPIAVVERTGAAQSIPSGADTAVAFDTITQDSLGGVASASNTPFTLPFTGTYLVVGNAGIAAAAAGTRFWWLAYDASSANYLMPAHQHLGTAAQPAEAGAVAIFPGTAGQTIKMWVFQDSGGALNTFVSGRRRPMVALYLLSYS